MRRIRTFSLPLRQARSIALLGSCILVLIGVVAIADTLPTPAAFATTLQDQAQAISAEITAQSVKVHVLATEQVAAKAHLAEVELEVALNRKEQASSAAQVASDRAILRKDAINAFVGAGSGSDLSSILNSAGSDLPLRQEYLSVATGDLSTAVSALQGAEEREMADQVQLRASLHSAQLAVDALEADSSKLAAEVANEQATLNSVNSQIAALVAQAQAQAQAKAQAAARAALAPVIQTVQGLPSPSGFAAAAGGAAGTSSWGGNPAPPSPAAFAALRQCESGDNYTDNTGNGYYGAYQFSLSTWQGMGYPGLPSNAPPAMQDQAARQLQAEDGWGQWPACSSELGLD